MSAWRRYDSHLMPAFHERFEERWGEGTAPFLDPEAHEVPLPRAQWINVDTGAALAVVPIWTVEDSQHRSFGVFYLPPAEDIWVLRPGFTGYLEPAADEPSSWWDCGTTRSRKPWPTPRNSSSGRNRPPTEARSARRRTSLSPPAAAPTRRSWRGHAARPKISPLRATT